MIGTSVMKELYSFQKKLTFVELLQSYAKLAFKNHVQEGFLQYFLFLMNGDTWRMADDLIFFPDRKFQHLQKSKNVFENIHTKGQQLQVETK